MGFDELLTIIVVGSTCLIILIAALVGVLVVYLDLRFVNKKEKKHEDEWE
jgi:hypothetical protein